MKFDEKFLDQDINDTLFSWANPAIGTSFTYAFTLFYKIKTEKIKDKLLNIISFVILLKWQ